MGGSRSKSFISLRKDRRARRGRERREMAKLFLRSDAGVVVVVALALFYFATALGIGGVEGPLSKHFIWELGEGIMNMPSGLFEITRTVLLFLLLTWRRLVGPSFQCQRQQIIAWTRFIMNRSTKTHHI